MKYKNNYLKSIEEDFEGKFNDYRDIDEERMEKYINEKLGEPPIHQFLKHISLNDLL